LKTHPAQWAVGSVTLGSEAYTQAELLTLLTTPVSGDASSILADQLIAAKLNLANGSSPTPIISTIANADSLLRGFAGKLPYEVRPNSAAGHAMIHDANVLAQYNGGALTPTCSAAALVDPSAAETLSIVAQIEAMETACAGGPVGLRRRLESPSDPRDDAAHVRIRWWRGRMEAQRAVRLAHEYVVEDERVKVPSLPG